MVVLRAIKRNQNKIEADYYPENRNARIIKNPEMKVYL